MATPSSSTRSILAYKHWDSLTVDTLKLLWLAWQPGTKLNNNLKQTFCNALVGAEASIDWPRINRWQSYGIVDPGENPEEDVELRGWLTDRAMYTQMQAGKVVIAKHFKGLDPTTGTFSTQPAVNEEVQPASGAQSSTPSAVPPTTVVQPPAAIAQPVPSMAPGPAPSALHIPQPTTVGRPSMTPPPPTVLQSATAGGAQHSQTITAVQPPPVNVASAPVHRSVAELLNITCGDADDDRALLAECIQAEGFTTVDGEEPAWGNNGLPTRGSGKLYATGDVALYGLDPRPDTLHPRGKMVFVVMKQANLRYVPQLKAVVVKGPEVFKALAADVRFRDGNVCFTVPVAVHGTVMDFAVGLVDSDGDAHPNPPIYLHAIPQNPEMSSPSFRYIRFGVQFRADPYFEDNPPPSESELGIGDVSQTISDGKDGRKTSAPAGKKGNFNLDYAQAQWLRTTDEGAYLENEAIQLLRSTPPKSNYPYDTVVTIARAIYELAKIGWLPDSAPDPAKGTKIRYTAIAQFVGRTAGWVGNAVKLHEQLQAYKTDKTVQSSLRRRRNRHVGVKTLLKVIKDAVDTHTDEAGDADGNQQDDDEDDDGDGEGQDGDEDDELYSAELPPKGVRYGRRIIDEPDNGNDQVDTDDEGSGGGASSAPARKKTRISQARKSQAGEDDDPASLSSDC